MKAYLHLADSGLLLSDLALRLYDEGGAFVSSAGATLAALSTATDYVLDGLPDVPAEHSGLTLTINHPEGVYSALRFGAAASQPSSIVIPIREVLADPLADLEVTVFQDGEAIDGGDLTATQIGPDGEYLISGWDSPGVLGEQWSIRWQYGGDVYAIQWVGTALAAPTPSSIIVACENAIKAADLDFPVRFARQPKGWGWLAGAEVEIPVGAAAEWVEVSIMPRVDEEQVTSSPAALVGTKRPQRLAYATYYGPDGPGSADAVAKAKSVLSVLAGDTIGDSSGGVYFEQGSGYQTLGTSGGRFQLQAWLRGMLLYSEAA